MPMRSWPWRSPSTRGPGRPSTGERPLRRLTSCYDQPTTGPLRRPVECALGTAVAVMYEPAAMDGPPIMEGLLQRIEHEARMCCPGDTPAHDATGVGVDDEGDVDEARPGCNVGE